MIVGSLILLTLFSGGIGDQQVGNENQPLCNIELTTVFGIGQQGLFSLITATTVTIFAISAATLDTKFGNMAQGRIGITKHGKVYSGKGDLPFISNPILPPGFSNAGIHIDIPQGNVNGRVYFGEQKARKDLAKSAEVLELFGIQALDPKISGTVNTITKGQLRFGIEKFGFSFGNALNGTGRFVITNDGIDFAAGGTVSIKGLEGGGKLDLVRTEEGLIKGDVDVQVALQKGKFAGALHVAFNGESFSGEGSIAYSSDKFSGNVNLRLMDIADARISCSTQKQPYI